MDGGARGPGWSGTILISLITSSAAVIGFQWAAIHGMLPPPLRAPTHHASHAGAEAAGAQPDSGPQEVPMLIGLALETGRELLQARGLRLVVRDKHTHGSLPLDSVIAQEPLPGSMLPVQSEVQVTLSSGPAKDGPVPDLKGMSVEDAARALQAAGFMLGPTHGPESGPRTVASTVPPAGTPAKAGSEVALHVSPVGVEVPKLVGLSWFKAKQALEEAGLEPGKVRIAYNDNRAAYVVLKQSPEPGTVVEVGSAVDIVRNEGD